LQHSRHVSALMIDGCDSVTFWSPVCNSSLLYAHFMWLGQGLATRVVRVNTIDIIPDGMCGEVTRQQVGRPGNQVAIPVCRLFNPTNHTQPWATVCYFV